MRKIKFVCLILLLFSLGLRAQLGFTLNPLQCLGSTTTLTANSGTLTNLSYTWQMLPVTGTVVSPQASSTTVSFFNTGTYTLVLSVLSGSNLSVFQNTCTVNSVPSITVTQTSYTTCIMNNNPKFSKPVVLNASGATSYVWFPYQVPLAPCGNCPQTTVRPHVNSCYTVVGTSAVTGCTGSATTCVTVVPQFTFNVSPASTLICSGQTVALIAGNIGAGAVGIPSSFTYSWTESNPVTVNTVLNDTVLAFPNLNTTYTVDVADSFSCVSFPVTVTVIVNDCVNLIENDSSDFAFIVFPNPVKGQLTVESYLFQIEELELRNSLGQKLMLYRFKESKNTGVSVSDLPDGVYYIIAIDKKGRTFQKKFVKE